MPLDRAGLQERADRSPYNKWLGIRVDDVMRDSVRLSLELRPEMLGASRGGMVHGGIFSALVDIGGSLVILATAGGGVTTVDLTVDYHRPCSAGTLLIEATILRIGRTLATGVARIMSVDGTLLVSGRGLYARIAEIAPGLA